MAWSTGTGKSFAALELAQLNRGLYVIVVPKSLKEKWSRDTEMYATNGVGFCLLTKEEFRKDWDKLPRADGVIVDEAHYFSGMKSAMSKSFLAYCRKNKPSRIWLLTATPYLSTPWNIYRLAQLLGYNWNYMTFFNKFFHQVRLGRSTRMVPMQRKGMEEEVAALVKQIGDVVDLEDCADVPDQVFETENFKTNPKQQKLIEAVKKKETNPVVRFTKFHQIENGSLKGDEYNEDVFVEADKHERILELAQENKKLAVFCRYNLQIDSLHSLLTSKLKGKLVYIIRGDVKNRDEIVQQIEAADECVVLINAACSEGYELPSVGVIVFASMSFSYKDYKQSLGRFLRINKLKKNVFIHLINEGSVDEAVFESISNKQDFDIAIYAQSMLK